MKLSFVIPAYNEESYLGSCLDSIIRESATGNYDLEIIVVNNASTDRTREVALSYPGVKVVDEPRKGLLYARQAGYLASSGELIANIDSDTRLTRGWIQTVFDEFENNPRLVALSGPFIYYDMPMRMNIGIRIYYYFGFIAYLINRFILQIGSMLQGGNFVVRRIALEIIGGYNLNISFYGEDTDMANRLRKVGGVKFTFKLPIYSSARRLKKEGVGKMALKYPLNYFWMTFFKRPFSKEYIDIRENHH